MDELEITTLFGDGEPMDEFTAASLGIQLHTHAHPHEDEYNREGWSRLMYAIHYHRRDVIKALANEYAEGKHARCQVNTTCRNYTTPLSLAVLSGHLPTIQLLQSKEMLDGKDGEGKTALYLAVETNQTDIVKHLLFNGAAVNTLCRGRSCLTEASRIGSSTVIQVLLDFGASVAIEGQIDTPLNQALECGNMEAVNTLMTHIVKTQKLEELFKQINLQKYWAGFQQNGIGYKEFLAMSETDLKNNGVRTLGPRKKLAYIISLLRTSQP